MSDFIMALTFFIFWISAVVHDAAANNVGWLLADFFLFPLGVVRGLYLMFTGG